MAMDVALDQRHAPSAHVATADFFSGGLHPHGPQRLPNGNTVLFTLSMIAEELPAVLGTLEHLFLKSMPRSEGR